MANQKIIDNIRSAFKNKQDIVLPMGSMPSDITIDEIATEVRNLTGRDIRGGIKSAFDNQAKFRLPFSAEKSTPIGENRATAIREELPSEKYFGAIPTGLAEAAAGLKFGLQKTLPGALAMGTTAAGIDYIKQLTQAIGSEPGTPKTALESGKRLASSFVSGAGGELVGRGLFGLVNKIAGPIKLNEFQKTLRETFDKYGISYTPADIAQSKSLSLMESMASKTPIAGDVMLTAKKGQIQGLKNATEELVSKSGGRITPTQAGDIIIDAVKSASQKASQKKDALYDLAYSKIDKNIPVRNAGLKSTEVANEILNNPRYGRLGDISPQVNDILQKISPPTPKSAFDPVTKQLSIPSKPVNPFVLVGDLIEDSKKLNDYISGETAAFNMKGLAFQTTTEGRDLLKLKRAMETDIDSVLGKHSPDAYKALSEAKKFYGKTKQTFDSQFIKGLVKTNPEQVVDKLVKYNNSTDLKKIKDIVGDDAFNSIRRRTVQDFAEGVFGTPSEQSTKELFFKHSAVKNMLSQYSPETLEVVFGKDGIKELENIVKISNAMGTAERIAGNPSGTAQTVNMFGNLAALFISPVTAVGTMTGTIGLPYVYSKLITSKAGRELILDGMKVKPGTKEAAKFATRFINFATIEMAKEPSNKKRAK